MLRACRTLALVLLMPLLVLVGLPGSAHADPVPAKGHAWPRCGTAPDTDGKYCIVSVTKDGAAVPPVDLGTPGTYDDPFVDLDSAGTVAFGLKVTTVTGSGSTSSLTVSPDHTWVYTVNTGAIRPVELFGNVRNAAFSLGGNATKGHTFTVTFLPTPVAWRQAGTCSVFGGCGDNTTVADTVRAGFAKAFVSDESQSGQTPAQIAAQRGYVNVYNAQDAYFFYTGATNSLVMRMANPHLQSPGVTAKGSFQTGLPNTMLIDQLRVPYPSALTHRSFSVVRKGVGPVAFTLSHYRGGVDISIQGFTFSTPEFTIHPKPTPPGTPRWGSAKRVTAHHVKVTFRHPRADGGRPVTRYAARCRQGSGAWHRASAHASPIVVGSVPKGPATCQVRARNTIGWGVWNTAHAVH